MYHVASEYGVLKKVLLARPEYLDVSNPINVIAEKHSKHTLNVEQACKEHALFVEALEEHDVEVYLAETHPRFPYEVNTRDLGVSTEKGIVFGRFQNPYRWGEHRLAERTLHEHKIPIHYQLTAGNLEGGDVMYIDEKTVGVGTGIRTDETAVKALETYLHELGKNIIQIPFSEKYLHLDMIMNVIGEKVAIICEEALPHTLVKWLEEESFQLIRVSEEDVFLHKCNLLNIGNQVIISHHQAASVNTELKELGYTVVELALEEILKSGGGPRCMSFPVERE
ncbi:dimethylarginine dimethylaminohydrolase family protein [Pontibacillus salicampi]|uniref:Dimethylarginine dimethylaminohydrolase family protein n=1 Tax=Pontibacillus salicampi TaxID=1449801 RepID=A0ABV6LQB7_9BACI